MTDRLVPVLIALGGFVGSASRYLFGTVISDPGGTLFVNVVGSLLLGALVASAPADATLAIVGTGFCGAFTTFSSFAVNVACAASTARFGLALADAVGTLVSALVGIGTGWFLMGL